MDIVRTSTHKDAYLTQSLIGLLPALFITAAQAAPIADEPLFMGAAAKPNLMLAIDNSGSMDYEVLLDTNDGGLWWDYVTNSFVNDDGSLIFQADRKFAYLFPNGYSIAYDGQRMRDNSRPAIPPVKAYAFIRSADFNAGYYDTNATYQPWPSYGGFTFTNIDPTQAPWDPVFNPTTFNLDLTQNLNSSDPFWQFFILDSGMVCDDVGTRNCPLGDTTYNYYPATFYAKDTTSVYTYNKPGPNSYQLDPTQSIILEAESATPTPPLELVTGGEFQERASDNLYLGSPEGIDNSATPPTSAEATYSFTKSGMVNIWIRRQMKSSSTDSMWISVSNVGYFDVTLNDFAFFLDWFIVGTDNWHRWSVGHDTPPNRLDESWQWELWGTANLTGSNQELKIATAEGGVLYDQILITSNLTLVPSGDVTYDDGTAIYARDCAQPQKSQHYHDFVDHPTQFNGVDAIAPDGSCLKKYEIKPTTTTYPSGRSYAAEMQNFANWFTYYRRRHHAMRGGLAKAFDGISGIRAGMFYINDRVDVTMEDFDASKINFLNKNYLGVERGSTPLRSGLEHAGRQFMRTDANAPIIEACQKNYTLLFTDGYNTDMSYSSVGNVDNADSAPFADGYSNTLADIARFYYKNNPRPDLPSGQVINVECDGSSPPWMDCNSNLHMNTFTVSLGTEGRIFGKTHHKVQDAFDNPPVWPNVNISKDPSQVDDLYHAAVNGHGEIFNARNTAELANVLSEAVESIIEEKGSSSSLAVNSSSLNANSLTFRAGFDTTDWSGEFKAFRIDNATAQVTTEQWDAGAQLDARVPNSRVIITHDGSDGVPFRWANLNATQTTDLNTAPDGTLDTNGRDRLDYIRGDNSRAGTLFRERETQLGAIINSSPVFVGSPEMKWPSVDPFGDASYRYEQFKRNYVNRTPAVYVGANDGMLHGFIADNSLSGGYEAMAYVPGGLYSTTAGEGLHYLTDPSYSLSATVDLESTVSDVYIDTGSGTRTWATILVGGLRGGGKGLFALDVTDPSTYSEGNAANIALWEFTSNDDPDMGELIRKPSIAMMANNKWAVIFGNGYNNTGDGGGHLFILFIEEGVDGTWSAGDYMKLPTQGSTGLSAATVADEDGDSIADRIYAGDLEGNIWAFDVSNSNPSRWESAYKQGPNLKPLFTAKIGTTPQPIVAAPTLIRNGEVTSGSGTNVMVLFGTGKYFSVGDPTSTATQSFYGVWDKGDDELLRSNLEPRTLTNLGSSRTVSGNAINWSTQHGYYMDLPDPGERIMSLTVVREEVAFFNTIMPNSNVCEAGGQGWLMSLDANTGLLPSSAAYDTNGDGQVSDADTISAGQLLEEGMPTGSTFLDDNQLIGTTDGQIISRRIITGEYSRLGRLAWTEKFRRR